MDQGQPQMPLAALFAQMLGSQMGASLQPGGLPLNGVPQAGELAGEQPMIIPGQQGGVPSFAQPVPQAPMQINGGGQGGMPSFMAADPRRPVGPSERGNY